MCKARNSKWIRIGKKRLKVDSCIAELIKGLNNHGIKTLASCCGHGIYPVTIVYQVTKASDILWGNRYELGTGWGIRRKSRYYLKNKKNKLFYIPEVSGKSGEITLPSATLKKGN